VVGGLQITDQDAYSCVGVNVSNILHPCEDPAYLWGIIILNFIHWSHSHCGCLSQTIR